MSRHEDVYEFLSQQQKPVTSRQLQESMNLPRRTVYGALKRLREEGRVATRASLKDTRQSYYWVQA